MKESPALSRQPIFPKPDRSLTDIPHAQNSHTMESALFDSSQARDLSSPIHIPVRQQGGSLIIRARLSKIDVNKSLLILDPGRLHFILFQEKRAQSIEVRKV
ncbi:MAG: hypothetical protein GKS05_10365 [Nitrospirales bacterium]|nr:hypothetical protein [Nitrospirales bacterium]